MRFEPFIMHAECRGVAVAAQLLHTAKLAGFRESGLSLGASGQRAMVRLVWETPGCLCMAAAAQLLHTTKLVRFRGVSAGASS